MARPVGGIDATIDRAINLLLENAVGKIQFIPPLDK